MFTSEPISSPYTCVKRSFYRNEFYIKDYLRFEVNLSVIRRRRYFVTDPVRVAHSV